MRNINFKVLIGVLGIATMTLANIGCSSNAEGKETTFKVYGNCEMCEKTIEGSLKDNAAVSSVDWNTESKMITISYDPKKIKEQELHKEIAASGYDTDLEKGNDEAYKGLHECCKYDRKK